MAIFRLATATRNSLADHLGSLLDGGTISFYDGAQPKTADAEVTTQNILAVLSFDSPAFDEAEDGAVKANAIAQENALATARPEGCTWARLADSTGKTVVDCDVGETGTAITVNTMALVKDGPVIVRGFEIIAPEG